MGVLAIPIIGDVWDAVAGVFSKVAGAALDGVISLITSWVIGGVLAAIEATWHFMDTETQTRPAAEWFAGTPGAGGDLAPAQIALTIGGSVLAVTMVLAVVRAALAGSPGAVTRTICHDLPMTVFAMAATIGGTKAALDVTDEMSNWIWAVTRDDAKRALEHLSKVLMAGLVGTHFFGVVICIGLLLAMAFLIATLFVRSALIYLVIVLVLAFGWPCMMFPPLRDTARKSLELLVALIVSKPVITLALSVGVHMIGAVGGAGDPGDGVGTKVAREVGLLLTGLICFGLAAFMPYVVLKLMPVVVAAVVAQGIASGPLRGVQTAAQVQYYGAAATGRLAAGKAKQAGASGSAGSGSKAVAEPSRSRTTDRLAGATR